MWKVSERQNESVSKRLIKYVFYLVEITPSGLRPRPPKTGGQYESTPYHQATAKVQKKLHPTNV